MASSALALSGAARGRGRPARRGRGRAPGRRLAPRAPPRAARSAATCSTTRGRTPTPSRRSCGCCERETDEGRRERYRAAAREAIELLDRFQYVDGGWGYYDFSHHTKKPGHGQANSFTTATALVALGMARDAGIEVPDRLVRPAARLVRMSRLPGGAYAYGFDFSFRSPWGVNKPEGSLARTPACQAALLAWGDPVPDASRPRPRWIASRSWGTSCSSRASTRGRTSRGSRTAGTSASTATTTRPRCSTASIRTRARDTAARIAAHLVPLQEEDGSFWDYQLFGYHKAYGTGYVLVALGRCLNAAPTTGP